jgi:glycosyltransferase involved in cell wall biosynthesis
MYVHGHSAGGTNPSLVEAMALGLPVVAFDVTYNRETTENASLYFENAEQLIRVIRETTETDLQKVGAKMKEIAKRRYTWKRITNEYAKLFTS